jgi:transcriptional regulator with XRE-family HTH domain
VEFIKIGERIRNLREMSNLTEEKMVDRERERVVINNG